MNGRNESFRRDSVPRWSVSILETFLCLRCGCVYLSFLSCYSWTRPNCDDYKHLTFLISTRICATMPRIPKMMKKIWDRVIVRNFRIVEMTKSVTIANPLVIPFIRKRINPCITFNTIVSFATPTTLVDVRRVRPDGIVSVNKRASLKN